MCILDPCSFDVDTYTEYSFLVKSALKVHASV